ncbi:MAG: glycosyltransferase family 9 protein [Verrucomicrobia bacterium]|nr:glycosyltransferase family 9 protein [Verrucomicrobiota bacterium]
MTLPDKPRILIIRGGAIGDFILTLPAIGALRERWPQAHLEILGYPRIAVLAERRHYADAVRSIDAAALARFFAVGCALDPALSQYFAGFDLVVSYLYDPDNVFSDNLRRAGVRQLLCGSAKPETEHAASHFLRPLAELGLTVSHPVPRVFPSAEDRAFADQFHQPSTINHSPSPVAIHPGSGGGHKVWPVERWFDIIRWLREQGREILLVGGEADDAARDVLAPLGVRTAWSLLLPQLAAVLEGCALFAGHDSGITHLAAAVGCPTLALFGPTSPQVWAPLGPHVRVLAANGPMEGISTDQVREALAAMLAATKNRSAS